MNTNPTARAATNAREQAARNAEPTIQKANQPEKVLAYAQEIARNMCADHFPDTAERFEPYGDLFGVLSQIDNMACGLVRGTPEQIEEAAERRRQRRFSESQPSTKAST